MGGCQNGGEEVALLAAFFTLLGDQLALLSLYGGDNRDGDVKSS